MNAEIYTRISRNITEKGVAIKRKFVDCRTSAADRSWVVAEVYDDNDCSSHEGGRHPTYQRMLEGIEAGQRASVIE